MDRQLHLIGMKSTGLMETMGVLGKEFLQGILNKSFEGYFVVFEVIEGGGMSG